MTAVVARNAATRVNGTNTRNVSRQQTQKKQDCFPFADNCLNILMTSFCCYLFKIILISIGYDDYWRCENGKIRDCLCMHTCVCIERTHDHLTNCLLLIRPILSQANGRSTREARTTTMMTAVARRSAIGRPNLIVTASGTMINGSAKMVREKHTISQLDR